MKNNFDKSVISTRKFVSAIILFACFVLFTVAVLLFDVQAIGPNGSSVGFAEINGAFRDAIGTNNVWYEISEYLGYAALGIAAGFALFGLFQLIRRKSLKKVDPEIWLLAALYADLAICYVLFEALKINYRPTVIFDDGKLEASYPSSHCLLAMVIFGSAVVMIRKYIKKHTLSNIAVIVVSLMLSFMIAGRTIAGVHWLTDIIGGILLGAALVALFYAAVDTLDNAGEKAANRK